MKLAFLAFGSLALSAPISTLSLNSAPSSHLILEQRQPGSVDDLGDLSSDTKKRQPRLVNVDLGGTSLDIKKRQPGSVDDLDDSSSDTKKRQPRLVNVDLGGTSLDIKKREEGSSGIVSDLVDELPVDVSVNALTDSDGNGIVSDVVDKLPLDASVDALNQR